MVSPFWKEDIIIIIHRGERERERERLCCARADFERERERKKEPLFAANSHIVVSIFVFF